VTLFNRKIVVTYQITGMRKAWHGGPWPGIVAHAMS